MCLFSQYPSGQIARGFIHGGDGFVTGPEYEAVSGVLSATPSIRDILFNIYSPFYSTSAAVVVRNGSFYSIEDNDGVMDLANLEDDGAYVPPVDGYERLRFWPIPVASVGNAEWIDHPFLAGLETEGGRVRLTWTDEPDEADFDAFVLYWDEGLGAGANTLLARIERRSAREYVTSSLDVGTYVFRLEYANRFGQETNANITLSVDIGGIQDQPVVQSWSVDGSAWTIDVVLDTNDPVWVFSNLVPGWGLEDYIWFGGAFSAKPSGLSTWTSPRLWPGIWRFAFLRVSAEGVLGPPDYLYLIVTESGGVLSAAEAFFGPASPVLSVDSRGDVIVRWFWIGTVPAGAEVEIEVNGVFDQYATASDQVATVTGSPGTTFSIRIRGVVSSVDGPWRGPVSITTSSAAPVGDHTLSAEVF